MFSLFSPYYDIDVAFVDIDIFHIRYLLSYAILLFLSRLLLLIFTFSPPLLILIFAALLLTMMPASFLPLFSMLSLLFFCFRYFRHAFFRFLR